MDVPQTRERKSRSAGSKLLIGCGLGCGAVVLAAFLLVGGGAWWFFVPGEQIATVEIAGEDSAGVVVMDDLAADPGAAELLTHFLTEMDKISRRQQEAVLPPEMRWLAQIRQSPSMRDVQMLIPKDVTLAIEPGETGGPGVVAAVNFRGMVRPFKAMLRLAGREGPNPGIEYRGHEIYGASADDEALAFVGSTLLVAGSRTALERAIDRIEDGAPGAAAAAVAAAPEGDWDAAGTITNEDGAASDLLRDLAGTEPAPEEPLELAFGVDVVSADEVTSTAVLRCRDRERAALWQRLLEERFDEMAERAAGYGLELAAETEVRGAEVESRLRLTGLETSIAELFENMVQFEPAPPG